MIVSTDEHEGILELTVLGSTERMINWINTVEEKDPSRRIEIEDIERKGNVVYVHCAIKSIINLNENRVYCIETDYRFMSIVCLCFWTIL